RHYGRSANRNLRSDLALAVHEYGRRGSTRAELAAGREPFVDQHAQRKVHRSICLFGARGDEHDFRSSLRLLLGPRAQVIGHTLAETATGIPEDQERIGGMALEIELLAIEILELDVRSLVALLGRRLGTLRRRSGSWFLPGGERNHIGAAD